MEIDSPNSLKRCSSAPHINELLSTATQSMTTQTTNTTSSFMREALPTSFSNIFTPRARRFSASYSPLALSPGGQVPPTIPGIAGNNSSANPPRLTPRISQLRQEECADGINTREANHEREIHSAMQMSQSCEDITIATENFSFKNSDELMKSIHVSLPLGGGGTCCSSPSPTSRSSAFKMQSVLSSPSPTRKTFATRRSMSPIAMRPSPLGTVKRKFDMDDNYCNNYSPPPLKKMFTQSRGSSPICQTPSPLCPSPESSTSYEGATGGRLTPKIFAPKLFTNTNSLSSLSSSTSADSSPSMMSVDVVTHNSHMEHQQHNHQHNNHLHNNRIVSDDNDFENRRRQVHNNNNNHNTNNNSSIQDVVRRGTNDDDEVMSLKSNSNDYDNNYFKNKINSDNNSNTNNNNNNLFIKNVAETNNFNVTPNSVNI